MLWTNQIRNYYWDSQKCQYVHAVNGRPVSEQLIMDTVQRTTNLYEQEVGNLVNAVYDEAISPSTFAVQMGQTLKRYSRQMSALGAGGFDRLTPTHYGRMGGLLSADYRRLKTFSQDIALGKITEGQAFSRARMYVGNHQKSFYRGRCEPSMDAEEMIIERRTLQPAEHCPDCLRYAAMGWQPAGTLPDPGTDSECLSNCRCLKLRRVIKRGQRDKWIGRRRSR